MSGFSSIKDIKTANKTLGHYWFDSDTIDNFGSRVETDVIDGYYFVESRWKVRGDDQSGRGYSAAVAADDGGIQYVGSPTLGTLVRDTLDEAIADIHNISR